MREATVMELLLNNIAADADMPECAAFARFMLDVREKEPRSKYVKRLLPDSTIYMRNYTWTILLLSTVSVGLAIMFNDETNDVRDGREDAFFRELFFVVKDVLVFHHGADVNIVALLEGALHG